MTAERNKSGEALIKKIDRAFSPVPHPAPDKINPYPCCPDHDGMTEWFRAHTRRESQELLKEGTLDSEFMPSEPEAFIYFLPAVLRYALEAHESQRDQIWEWKEISGITCAPVSHWIEVLVPLWEEPFLADFLEIRERCTPEQRNVIVEYLEYFLRASPVEQDGFRENIQRALQNVWAAGAGKGMHSERLATIIHEKEIKPWREN
jgi:hypothetical protein